MKTKLSLIILLFTCYVSSILLAGCSNDENIGGGVWPVALHLEVTDAEGNSLLDYYNNPDNIIVDDDTRAQIKAVEGDVTYSLVLSDEIPLTTAQKTASRAAAPAHFYGLYLSEGNFNMYTGGNGPYISFGSFEGDKEVNRSITLYLPRCEKGIDIDYRRVKDPKSNGGLRTVIVIDGVEQHDEIPRITIPDE